ncbi:SinI family restriction endonuclease [uncultured Streptococcus sp.]|uniref:SinI family restriction endonuclease n=1 Tax=uncultured Streptococcus sp. TaxID=83427 RepID=UPI0026228635|nr:SinI family restriction endonuclease [uncultured Streptococcus sp.]
MVSKSVSLKKIVDEYDIDDEVSLDIFHDVLNCQEVSIYNNKLEQLFLFAVNNKELFTNIRVTIDNSEIAILREYIEKWVSAYIKDRENDKLLNPLKNYGERDEALVSRIRASTGADEEVVNHFIDGHYLFMSAENMNGAILEQYLAYILEPKGWLWCAGAIYRAIDFCYFGENEIILLQVKNKYNTENSSSSAIRIGTDIIKWNRLNRPKAGTFRPIPNWEKLQDIVGIPSINYLLTEEMYLDYIEKNSTTELDQL